MSSTPQTSIARDGDDLDEVTKRIKSKIRTVPDWPKKGIQFRDVTTLLRDGEAFSYVIDQLDARYSSMNIDVIVGIESRGFIFGSALANVLGVGFVPIRKPNKLPAKKVSLEYALEYGTDKIEMHVDSIDKGQNVLLVDDLIATGGTALAACQLVEKVGGKIMECCFVVDLPDLKGRAKLEAAGYKVFSLVEYAGD